MQEVLSRLLTARERGDPADVAALFVEQAVLEIVSCSGNEDPFPLVTLSGAEAIGQALTSQPERSSHIWAHHSTNDHVVRAQGDFGRVDAQFLLVGVVSVSGSAGQPTAPALETIEAGSYHADLRRTPGGWKIWRLRISQNWPLPVRVSS